WATNSRSVRWAMMRTGNSTLYPKRAQGSKRDRQQRVDLVAVEHDDALDEAAWLGRDVHAVAIDAGGEQHGVAVVHGAHDQEMRACRRDAGRVVLDPDRADDVAIALRLVDVGIAQRRHAI